MSALRPEVRVEARVEAVELERTFRLGGGLFGRGRKGVRAVDGVSLSVERGRTLGLVGESGSGKTTVGRMLLGLLRPTAGVVRMGGVDLASLPAEELRRMRRSMQMVFQDPYSSLNPRMRVADAIAEPLEVHRPELGEAERRARVAALLGRVGLWAEHGERFPSEFSGGQRQRIVIARALASEPDLLVADEPVSALDVSIQAQIVNLLMDLQRERQLTLVFISHDLKVVEHVSDEVAVMYLGRVMERAPTAELFARPLHPYTEALLSVIPVARSAGPRRPRILLEGELPSPVAPPTGCTFHPRCPLYKRLGPPEQARCRAERPELHTPGGAAPTRLTACHWAEKL